MARTEGDRLRSELKRRMWPYLRGHGFSAFSSVRAWRYGSRWVDVVEFSPRAAGRPLGRDSSHRTEIESNGGEFGLEVGTYYTDLRLLPWTTKTLDKPRAIDVHRAAGLHRPLNELTGNTMTFWGDVDDSLGQAIATLEARGFGYLERYHDIAWWLAMPPGRRDLSLLDPYVDDAGRAELDLFAIKYPEDPVKRLLWPNEYQAFAAAAERAARPVYGRPLDKDQAYVAKVCKERGVIRETLLTIPKEFPNIFAAMERQIEKGLYSDHLAATPFEPRMELRTALLLGEGRTEEALAFFRSTNEESVVQGWLDDYIQQHTRPGTDKEYQRFVKQEIRWRTKNTEIAIREGRERIALLEAAFGTKSA